MYQLITEKVQLPEKGTRWKNMNYVFSQDNEARKIAKLKNEIFYTRKLPCRIGHTGPRYVKTNHCVECSKIAKINHRLSLSVEERRKIKKKYHLKECFNLLPEQYNKMLWLQNGVCAICKQKETVIHSKNKQIKYLAVDHCHTTGKIRGLLCQKCNQAIGLLKNNPELLRKAALYCEQS